MKRGFRIGVLILIGALLFTVLLESTVGAIGPLHIGRLADFRALAEVSHQDGVGGALWRLEPDTALVLGGGRYRVASGPQGRRVPAGSGPEPSAGETAPPRIVALGDGAVFGLGVAADATALRLLQTDLQESSFRGSEVWDVVDLSHPFEQLENLPRRLSEVQATHRPELVLLFDRASAEGLTVELAGIRDGTLERAGWSSWLPSLHDVVWRLSHPPEVGRGLAVGVDELADAAAAARAQGVQVVVVDLGARSEALQAACEARSVPCILARPARPTMAGRGLYDSLEGYPDEIGHRRIAENLREALDGL